MAPTAITAPCTFLPDTNLSSILDPPPPGPKQSATKGVFRSSATCRTLHMPESLLQH